MADEKVVPLAQLGIGTEIVTRAEPPVVVEAVEHQQCPQGIAVYNFEVEGDHTYFVGNGGGGLWVHNLCVAELLQNHYSKLQKILHDRGSELTGFTGNPNKAAITQLAEAVEDAYGKTEEVWQQVYRGSDKLLHIGPDMVVVTELDNTFVSIWPRAQNQVDHYRRGARIR